ncbi:hypothetical protein C1H46_045577 [Malus baccata]|uniref:CCHC-type domain-containing protein n=1 Tax=Malus baccata TaxID=106549 RepID=A0A540K3X2_MALBA|nr:hypothetical protein C1H46_045577 [Malus baccata]
MGELMTTLTTLKFDEGKGVREHILNLVNTAAKLKDLEVPVDEAFVVHMALTSLPSCYDQLKVTYSTQKEKWSMDELISIAAQEECRLRRNVNHAAVNLVHTDKGKKPFFHSGKAPKLTSNSSAAMTASSSKRPENYKDIMDNIRCYFCKRTGHMKRDCEKLKDLKTKKGFHKKRYNNKK